MAALSTAREATSLPRRDQREMTPFGSEGGDLGRAPHPHGYPPHRTTYHPGYPPAGYQGQAGPPGFPVGGFTDQWSASGGTGTPEVRTKEWRGGGKESRPSEPDYDNLGPPLTLSSDGEKQVSVNDNYNIRWSNHRSGGGAKMSEVSDVGVTDSGSHVWRGGEMEERAGGHSGVSKQPVSGMRVAVASWQEMGNDVSSTRGGSASRARALPSGKKHAKKARGKHRKEQTATVSPGEAVTGSAVRTEQHEMVTGVRISGQSDSRLQETSFESPDVGDNRRNGDGKSADINSSTHRTTAGPAVPGQGGSDRAGVRDGSATTSYHGHEPCAPVSLPDQQTNHRQRTENLADRSSQGGQTSTTSSRQVKTPLATLCVPASSGTVTSPAIIVTPASPDGQWLAGSASGVHVQQGMAGPEKTSTTVRQEDIQVVDNPSVSPGTLTTQVKTDDSDMKLASGSTIRSPPVGAVKVLPSAFTFNMKKFRDTKTIASETNASDQNTAISQTPRRQVCSGQRGEDKTSQILTSERKQTKGTIKTVSNGTSLQPSTPTSQTTSAASSRTLTSTNVVTSDKAADNSDSVPTSEVSVKSAPQAMGDNVNDTSALSGPSTRVTVSGKETTTPTSTSETSAAHTRYLTCTIRLEQPAVSQGSAVTGPRTGPHLMQATKSTKSIFVKDSEYKVITRSGQTTPQGTGAGGVVVSPTHVTTDTEEIYAVPIPKNQRPSAVGPRAKVSNPGQDQTSPAAALEPSLPPPLPPPPQELPPVKPPRPSPKESADVPDMHHQSGGFVDVTLRKNVNITGQMKKSTTTGMLHSSTHDYCNLPRSTSTGYDYFSLGRRPKRPRIPTLTDSRGMALSLDMLLKSRRQSSIDVSTSPQSPEQSLSVDDILKSCQEYDPNQPLFRSRSRSEITKKSPMPFSQTTHVHLVSTGTEEKGNLKRPSSPRPNRKKLNQSVTYEESEDDDIVTSDVSSPVTSRSPTTDHQTEHSKTSAATQEVKTSKSEKVSSVTTRPAQSVDTQDNRPKVNGTDVRSGQTESRSAANIKPKTKAKPQNGQARPGGAAVEMSSVGVTSGQVRSQASDKSCETRVTTQVKKAIPVGSSQHAGESTKSVVTNGQGASQSEKKSVSPNTSSVHTQGKQTADTGQYVTLTSRPVSSRKDNTTKPVATPGDVSTTKSQSFDQRSKLSASTATSQPSPSSSALTSTAGSAREVKVSTVLAEDMGVPRVIVTPTTRRSEPAPLHQPSSQSSFPPANNNNNHPNSSNMSRDMTLSSSSDPWSPASVSSDISDVMARPSSGASLSLEISMDGYSGDSPSPGRRSPNHAAKLEAAEALKWLRAAGFPQYAQMFDDGQFPVDLSIVERDHDFLDKDSIQSLFRRLETLNKHAGMKLDAHPRKKAASEEDDEDDLCALSERWEYQKSARRWSRKDLNQQHSAKPVKVSEGPTDLGVHSGSHDSLLADQESETGDSPFLQAKMPHQQDVVDGKNTSHGRDEHGPSDGQVSSPISPRLRRVASERIKTAKNLFKKMEGLKSKKSRRGPNQRNIVEISGPVVADRADMQAKLDRLNCVDISSPSDSCSPSAGVKNRSERGSSGDNTKGVSSPEGPRSPISPPSNSAWPPLEKGSKSLDDATMDLSGQDSPLRSRLNPAGQSPTARPVSSTAAAAHTTPSTHESSLGEYYTAQSTLLHNLQAAQSRGAGSSVKKNNSDTNLMEIFLLPQDHQPGRFPRMLQNGYIETEASGTAVNARTGSLRLGRDTGVSADQHRSHTAESSSSAGRSRSSGKGNRISMYDNFSPPDGKRGGSGVGGGAGEVRSVIPGITELGLPGSSAGQEAEAAERSESDLSGSRIESRESSVLRTSESVSGEESRDRSVSFQSSPQGSARETTPSSEEGGGVLRVRDSQTSGHSSTDSSGRSRGVPHSASADSYFQETDSASDPASSQHTSTGTLQQDYDEFDQILQQLYQNINDLSRYMNTDTDDRPPRLSSLSTEPSPTTFPREQPLHVATPTTLPMSRSEAFDLDSPTSDLMMSPASPLSPHMASESTRMGGEISELFQGENSSSGGEGSNTEGSEDAELVLTDLSHDDSLDQIPEISRDRRDSGVGHSLTRAPGERRRKKIRWHSFQRCHRPDVNSRAMQVNSLTVGQLVRLQKLSLLKLTGIMEKCLPVNKSGWNWMLPRFMKRQKAPDFSEKNVFGVPLSVMAQRTGQPLPQCVLYAMRYLRRTSHNAVGIFRKSGVKSKIQQLRDHLEAHPDTTDFEGINAYNVADMMKTYFRDLPECLLTTKMSETFRSIYTHVPQTQRLEAIQAAILLLPDENREVLQSILLFLSDISAHEADHQMNASNLAVCFTPTVFQLGTRQMLANSPKRNRKHSPGIPDPREILEQKAAHECLLMMITECKKLFTVPSNLFRQLQVQSLAHMEPTPLQDIGNSPSEVRAFGQDRIQMVLKEAHDKNRGWVHSFTVNDVEIYHRKPLDDCPLKEWKLIVDIEAPPIEVLRRIMHERHTWDEDLLSWSVMERLDPYSDIFQFVLNSMAPHPSRHFCVLRYWRSDLTKGACALITMSVEPSDAMEVQGVVAVDLGSYFLMEPCGSGRSRLTYITRVDTRGRMPEWYTKIFGHLCANFLERLKESFKQDATGPETKV